jgi:hypothetical protein
MKATPAMTAPATTNVSTSKSVDREARIRRTRRLGGYAALGLTLAAVIVGLRRSLRAWIGSDTEAGVDGG